MLTKQSSPVDIEYHIEQMKVLLISDEESKTLDEILVLEKLASNQKIKSFIDKELNNESWSYDTQLIINACKKKKEKNLIIINHIKECYNFMIFRSLEDKISNFPKIIISKEGNHKSFKWIFICHSKHEGDDPVRWANAKLNKALEGSTATAMFEILKDNNEQILVTDKWLNSNKSSFYSSDIFEDTNSLIVKKERERLKLQLIAFNPVSIQQINHVDNIEINDNNEHVEDDVAYL